MGILAVLQGKQMWVYVKYLWEWIFISLARTELSPSSEANLEKWGLRVSSGALNMHLYLIISSNKEQRVSLFQLGQN